MGKCNECKGKGKVRDEGWFNNFISTCQECGGSGSDKKPNCSEHKRSKKYNNALGWHCPKCEKSYPIGHAIIH